MFGNVPRELPQPIALILVPRFSFLPFTGLVESFRLANRLSGQELYRRVLVSSDGNPVTACWRLVTMPSVFVLRK